MVTVCGHLQLLCFSQDEKEFVGKPIPIAPDRLIQSLRSDTVQGRQIRVDDDTVTPHDENALGDPFGGDLACRVCRGFFWFESCRAIQSLAATLAH